MKIYICMKAAGKRRLVLDHVPYVIPDTISTLRDFLTELVHQEVEKYNSKGTDEQMVSFLTKKEIEEQAGIGKVGFGRVYSDKKADVEKAVENALLCYEDGLVRVFQNEEELEDPDEKIEIQDGDCFTLIRLTFFAGRMW